MTNLLRNIHYQYYMNGRVIEYNMPCFISHMTLGLLVLFQGIVCMCASFTQKTWVIRRPQSNLFYLALGLFRLLFVSILNLLAQQ
jgi:hypothetical protein